MRALGSAFENMLDLPCNQMINTIVSQVENDYSDSNSTFTNIMLGLFTSVCDGVGGFVPAPIKHLANAVDPVSRNVYSNTDNKVNDLFTQTGKKIANTIPGLNTKLEPFITANGEELKYSDLGLVLNYLTQISPARISQVNYINGTEELDDLLRASNGSTYASKSNTPMRYAPNKANYSGQGYEKGTRLTDEDKTQYMTAYAKYYNDNVLPIIKNMSKVSLTDKQKEDFADRLTKLQTQAKKYAEKYAMSN